MATTYRARSFTRSNLRERSQLRTEISPNGNAAPVDSVEGFSAGNTLYIGELGRETCEKAVVAAVSATSGLTLQSGVQYAHDAFSAVTSVLGDRIRIYRAVNVTDETPALSAFTVLATRSIDPDQPDTYYTDSAGSSGYWYTHTYFNETTLEETLLGEFPAVRGDDFNHYVTLEAIRTDAGFGNATNLSDAVVDQHRRAAESEVNMTLGGRYTVPFKRPIPELVTTIVTRLAAGLLLQSAYSGQSSEGDNKVKDARSLLMSLSSGSLMLPGSVSDAVPSGVDGYPDDDGERMFSVEDIY